MHEKITGFHIDMNVAQFRKDYLLKWLGDLSQRGYNTLLWELEDSVQWETCREAVFPQAFSKVEFSEILSHAAGLGLRSIPLLQTLGHAEYVLKQADYAHLRELPGEISQYCPLNPELPPFLKKLLDEYFELFGNVDIFHLGADEARLLGRCPACRKKVLNDSVSTLYIDHIQTLADYVQSKGARPAVWGDMLMAHPEALDKLPRNVLIFDWNYHQHYNAEKIRMWGRWPDITREELTEQEIQRFGQYLFPNGFDDRWNPFYATDFLLDKGFDVVTCSTSSSCGESVFCPDYNVHLPNVFDFSDLGLKKTLGTVLTSWTVRLHPWELQLAPILIPGFKKKYPDLSLADFKQWFTNEVFGSDSPMFFRAASLLGKNCFLGGKRGFGKACEPLDYDLIEGVILQEAGGKEELGKELDATRLRYEEYTRAIRDLEEFGTTITQGQDLFLFWRRAADLSLTHAEAASCILKRALGERQDKKKVFELRERMEMQKQTMYEFYLQQQRPMRARQISGYMFDALLHELDKIF